MSGNGLGYQKQPATGFSTDFKKQDSPVHEVKSAWVSLPLSDATSLKPAC